MPRPLPSRAQLLAENASLRARLSELESAVPAWAGAHPTDLQPAEDLGRLHSAALESAANAILITDRAGVIVWVNPAWSRLTGYALTETLGQTPRLLKSGRQPPEFYTQLWTTLLAGEVWQSELINRRKDGSLYTEDQIITPVRDERGAITHFVSLKQDVTQRKHMEAALQASEARYRLLAEHMADVIWVLNAAQKKFTYVSPSVEQLRGYTAEEVLAQPVDQALTPASGELVNRLLAERLPQFLAAPEPARFFIDDIDQPCKDGRIVHTEVTTRYCFNPHGELEIVGVSRDITARKQAEAALQATTQQLAALLANMQAGILFEDHTRRVALANQALCDLFGIPVPPQALVGSDCRQSAQTSKLLMADPEAFVSRIEAIVCERRPVINDELRLADGRIFERDYIPISIDDQRAGHLWQYREVTERKQAERAMAEERTRLRALISASRDGMALIGTDRQVYVVNEPALQYLNLPGRPADWEGRPLAEALRVMQAQAAPAALFADARRVEQGAEQPAEGEWALPARTLHWISQPVRAGDRWLGWLVVLRDVTAERQVEHLRDDLTRTMVHDLRNPLNSVSSALHLLTNAGDERLSASQQTVVDLALQGTESMLDLVTAILDVSRLESGQMPLQREPISLRQLTTQLVHQQTPVAQARGQTLTADFAPDLPAVYADAGLLRRVLQNLVGNALKFTPAGGRVELAAAVPAGANQMWLSVSDTGPGIAAEVRDRLFQKFVTGRVPGHGSGLGLAFCRQVVEAHGGRIWVEPASAAGGATFTFTMPIWEPPAEER